MASLGSAPRPQCIPEAVKVPRQHISAVLEAQDLTQQLCLSCSAASVPQPEHCRRHPDTDTETSPSASHHGCTRPLNQNPCRCKHAGLLLISSLLGLVWWERVLLCPAVLRWPRGAGDGTQGLLHVKHVLQPCAPAQPPLTPMQHSAPVAHLCLAASEGETQA